MQSLNTLAIGMPMGAEWLVILAIGLLIFGKRLPDLGKGMGQAIAKFKQGLRSSDDEVEQVDAPAAAPAAQLNEATAQRRFDPYTGKPVAAEPAVS